MNKRLAKGLAVSCVAAGLTACWWFGQQHNQAPPWGSRPECPTDSAFAWLLQTDAKRGSPATWQALDEIPLSGPISNIPEFHDCQRFIFPGDTYGPLFAIYASFKLSLLNLRADSLKDTTISHGRVAVPAATIFSYGGTYSPLGVEPGFNCLYLWNPPDWHARMVPKGYSEPDCTDPVDPSTIPGTDLAVEPMHVVGFAKDQQYPPVARWDWDSTGDGQQYIGIKCGAAWCEIGHAGFHSTPFYTSPPQLVFDGYSSTASPVAMVAQIKGWNDVQRLDDMASGKQVPTGIWGTVIPHPDNDSHQYQNGWQNAADVVLQGGDYLKRNFKEGVNRIYLCHGHPVPSESAAGAGCPFESGAPTCDPDPTDGLPWFAMIVSAASDTVYRCVKRRVHTGTNLPPIPAAARWRWVATDATNWIKCPSGCCEVR